MQADMVSGGDWLRGKSAIERYACGSCHIIPGINGAAGKVGPDLTHIAQRTALAGSLANHPGDMERWLMHPQKIRPGGGMPEQGVDLQDARDIAAYLYAQE